MSQKKETQTVEMQTSAAAAASDFVSVGEFAAHYGVSTRTVWRDIKKGAIKVARRVGPGRRPRIERAVMETYGKPEE